MSETEVPGAAVQIVAERMLRRYESEYSAEHISWEEFAADARGDLEAAMSLLLGEAKAQALDEAAEEIIIPRASSLAAAWLQGRAAKMRSQSESVRSSSTS